jgi:hypothetical protein
MSPQIPSHEFIYSLLDQPYVTFASFPSFPRVLLECVHYPHIRLNFDRQPHAIAPTSKLYCPGPGVSQPLSAVWKLTVLHVAQLVPGSLSNRLRPAHQLLLDGVIVPI